MVRAECSSCRFWCPFTEKRDLGQCRRNPLQLASLLDISESEIVSTFPQTDSDCWCGEYKPRRQDFNEESP